METKSMPRRFSMVKREMRSSTLSVFSPWLFFTSRSGMFSSERIEGVSTMVRMKETMIPKALKNPSMARPRMGWEIMVTKPTMTVTAEMSTGAPMEMMQFWEMSRMDSRVKGGEASCTSS